MHVCHRWEQCNEFDCPYPVIPKRLQAENRRGSVMGECTFFVRTSRIRPSHRAFKALGRFSWTSATSEFCPLVSTSKYSYLPFGFCPPSENRAMPNLIDVSDFLLCAAVSVAMEQMLTDVAWRGASSVVAERATTWDSARVRKLI